MNSISHVMKTIGKNALAVLVCLVLAFGLLPIFTSKAYAAGKPTISVDSKSTGVYPGSTFTVGVNIAQNPGITYYKIKLNLPAGFTLVGNMTNGSILDGFTPNPSKLIGLGDASFNRNGNGALFTVSVKVAENVALGSYSIGIASAELSDENGTTISANTTSGTIVVSQYVPAPETYTVSFTGGEGAKGANPDSVKKEAGETVVLPENPYVKDKAVFAGWSDGEKTYSAGESYTVGTASVVFTAVWSEVLSKEIVVDHSGVGDSASATTDKVLAQEAKGIVESILNGETPKGLDADAIAEIKELLKSPDATVKVALEVKETTVSEADKEKLAVLIEDGAESLGVFDINPLFMVNDKGYKMTELDTPISLDLPVNADLSGKTVRVLTIHNGVAKVCDNVTVDAKTGKVTVVVDEFSLFQVVSYDNQETAGPGSNTGSADNTLLMVLAIAFGGVALIELIVIVAMAQNRKKMAHLK